MFEKYLRRYLQRLFIDPVAKKLTKHSSLTPSHVTIAGCLVGILSALAIGFEWLWSGLFLLFLSGLLDTLDGTLARFKNKGSSFGSALDIVCDRIVEASVIVSLYVIHPETNALFSLAMLSAILVCVTSFLVVGIFSENTSNKSFYYSPGLIERGEAFLFFTFMICFPSFFSPLAILFTLLVFLTAAIRLVQFYRRQPA